VVANTVGIIRRAVDGGGIQFLNAQVAIQVICPLIQVNDTPATHFPEVVHIRIRNAQWLYPMTKCRVIGYDSDYPVIYFGYWQMAFEMEESTLQLYSPRTSASFNPESWAIQCIGFIDADPSPAGIPAIYSYWVSP